jgi:hypothetical protein
LRFHWRRLQRDSLLARDIPLVRLEEHGVRGSLLKHNLTARLKILESLTGCENLVAVYTRSRELVVVFDPLRFINFESFLRLCAHITSLESRSRSVNTWIQYISMTQSLVIRTTSHLLASFQNISQTSSGTGYPLPITSREHLKPQISSHSAVVKSILIE